MCRQQIPPNSAPPPPPAASFDPWSDGARLYQPIHPCQPTMATQPMLQELISLSTQGNKSAPVVYFLASLSFLIGDLPTWMLLMCVISFPLLFFSFICFHPLFYPDIRTLGLNALASSLAPSPPTYLPWLGKLFVKLTLFFLLFFSPLLSRRSARFRLHRLASNAIQPRHQNGATVQQVPGPCATSAAWCLQRNARAEIETPGL